MRAGLIAAALLALVAGQVAASVFSEAGSPGKAEPPRQKQQEPLPEEDEEAEFPVEMAFLNQAADEENQKKGEQYLMEIMEEEARREEEEKEVADEIMRQAQLEQLMAEVAKGYDKMQKDLEQEIDLKELETREAEIVNDVPEEKIKVAAKEEVPKEEPKQEETVDESAETQHTNNIISAQKKGQSEFVSFIDPDVSHLTKGVPTLEKRRMNEIRVERLKNDSSLFYLAVGCVMMVGLVGITIGGFLYKRRREEPDDQEYAPYAGTGPRSKKPIKGEKGDDTLAYKAQLHHYQQAKQKIICGEDNAVTGDSEDEGDIDDENNFSVYECPGLAHTGDIEVHNPNFSEESKQ